MPRRRADIGGARLGLHVGTLIVALAGCGDGPNPETLIDELRIVAAVADPPEVALGETYTLEVHVADPAGAGFEALVWSCPPPDAASVGIDTTCLRAPLDTADGIGAVELPALAPLPVWTIACEPGLCDLDTVSDRTLADPFGWLEELPLVGVTAASRTLRLTDLPPEERHTNPVVEEAPDPAILAEATPEDPALLRFVVPGVEAAYGSTTGGGFGMPRYDVASDGVVELEYYAPEEGPARVWVVFDDGLGGTAVWWADRP